MKLLEQLCLTAAVPGREHRMRRLVLAEIDGLFDRVSVDPLGSIIAVRDPRPKAGAKRKPANKPRRKAQTAAPGSTPGSTPGDRPTRVMVAAHMDQIGFLVSHIDDKGYCRVNPVGGFDTRNLFARPVTVCPDPDDPRHDLPGIMNPAGKPVHIASPEDRKKVPDVNEFFIDLGLDADAVKKKVKIGDMVVLQALYQRVGHAVASQALDNRVACWVAIEAIRKLKHHDAEIHCVFTVQEEVGLRGALTSAYTVKPDIGIGVDTTLCVDTPGVPAEDAVTRFGEGAALTVMDGASIADPAVLDHFEKLARKHRIKTQRSILSRGGTDTAGIQRAAGGARCFTLSCPTRYIHTVTEMVHTDDLHACRDLLAAYLADA